MKYVDLSLGSFLTRYTTVAEPMLENLPQELEVSVFEKHKDILIKSKILLTTTLIYLIKYLTNNYFNLSKLKLSDHSLHDLKKLKSISKILAEIDIQEREYENTLRISDDNNFQFHLGLRLTDFCFINNYFDNNLLT